MDDLPAVAWRGGGCGGRQRRRRSFGVLDDGGVRVGLNCFREDYRMATGDYSGTYVRRLYVDGYGLRAGFLRV
jgi:hypothetical protein